MKNQPSNKDNSSRPPQSSALKWAGLGIQLAVYIGVFVFIGYQLDEWQQTTKRWYTLVFSLLGIGFGMTYLIRTVLRETSKDRRENKIENKP